MKFQIIPILATLALSASTFAASFDTAEFGARLNGWKKNRTATYKFTDASYRTHIPTITYTPSGTMFLSTQIDLLSAAGKGAVCQIELTFSPSGLLEGAQIKADVSNKGIDTGLIRRPETPTPPPAPADGAPVATPRLFNGTDEMIAELFTSFDSEMKKVTEAKSSLRSDLFSRIAGNTVKSADLAAGLRHNLNLILQNIMR